MTDTNDFEGEGLTRLRVAGLGSLADVELRPGRLTVLIGPNGSGKSNILRALAMLPLMRTQSLQRFVGELGGASSLLHYGPKKTQALSLVAEFQKAGRRFRYRAELGFAAGDRFIFLDETVGSQLESDPHLEETSLGSGHAESLIRDQRDKDLTTKTVNSWLSSVTFFHFHDTSISSALRTNARAADDRYLRSDGSNLAAFLFRLRESDAEDERTAWRRINGYVRRVVPSIKELAPTPASSDGSHLRLDWIDDQDARFGTSQLSDGSLRSIALITALAQPVKTLPRFISIDEPELGLHPTAITLVAELADSISHRAQVLFATQSPNFLDYFKPEEVVVVEREGGASTLRRLDSDALAAWLDRYSLSEIYDKGVIGGRP